MPYQLFHDLFPEIAERETRTITVPHDSNLLVPAGEYAFAEMFCNEPHCDCRRVFFYVMSSLQKDLETVVAWGWEAPDFYARWMRDDDPTVVAELKGPSLNLGSPHTVRAPGILDMVESILLRDDAYVQRIKGHYALFRSQIDGNAEKRGQRGTTRASKRRRTRRRA